MAVAVIALLVRRSADLRRVACLFLVALALGATSRAGAQCAPAPADCTLSGTTNVGQDFTVGNLHLTSGALLNVTVPSITITAGSVTLDANAKIVAHGTALTIVSSGTVSLAGVVDTTLAAGEGGAVTLSAVGDVTIGGTIDTHGATDDTGGDVTITTSGGSITLTADAMLNAGAKTGGTGGTVTMTAPANLLVAGTIDTTAGDPGGVVDLHAGGQLTLASTGTLDASGQDDFADGGEVFLRGDGHVDLEGAVVSRGGSATDAGGGGDVHVDSNGDVELKGEIDVTGPSPDGTGGGLIVKANDVTMTGRLDAPGKGSEGGGGTVRIDASGTATLGFMDVSGGLFGAGRIDVLAQVGISIPAELNADSSNGGHPGTITAWAPTVTVAGNVHASRTSTSGNGGTISLHGCALTIGSTATVTTLGPTARNLLSANDSMVVNGHVTSGGSNVVEYASTPPVLNVAPVPAPVPPGGTLNPNLVSCTPPPPSSTTTSTSTTSTTSTSVTTITFGTTTTHTTATFVSTTTSTSRTTTSSSHTTTTTSTTTSSTIPMCGSAADCDDFDACSLDDCIDGGCVHTLADGVDAVTCRLEAIRASLIQAASTAVGGEKSRHRLVAKVDGARRTIAAAGAPGTGKARRKFKRAGQQIQALMNVVSRGTKKRTIALDLGGQILIDAGRAKSSLLPLQSR